MDFLNRLFGIAMAVAEESMEVVGETGGVPGADEPLTGGQLAVQFFGMLLPWILIFVVFYLLMIRPQRKKEKKVKEMLDNLKKDDRICTIGGIYGTIVSIKDDTVTLAVGKDNLSMVVARWAIRSVEDIAIENDSDMENLN